MGGRRVSLVEGHLCDSLQRGGQGFCGYSVVVLWSYGQVRGSMVASAGEALVALDYVLGGGHPRV